MNTESVRSLELGLQDEQIKEFDRKLAAENDDIEFNLWHEMQLLFQIAAPAMVVQVSVLFIFPQTASAVGLSLGTEALAGFSLGSLVGNLTVVSIMTGVLKAADVLMPRAWGAQKYEEMGILAVRGIIICSFFLGHSHYSVVHFHGKDLCEHRTRWARVLSSRAMDSSFFDRGSIQSIVPCRSEFSQLPKPSLSHGIRFRHCIVRRAPILSKDVNTNNGRERIRARHLFDTMGHGWPFVPLSSLQARGETRNMAEVLPCRSVRGTFPATNA